LILNVFVYFKVGPNLKYSVKKLNLNKKIIVECISTDLDEYVKINAMSSAKNT